MAAVVLAALAGLIGLVAAAGGGALVYVDGAKTDPGGYYTGTPHSFASDGHAIVTSDLELDNSDVSFLLSSGHLADIRLTARSNDPAKELFVGIAPEGDVEEYLSGVRFDEIAQLDFDPFSVAYSPRAGDGTPPPPAEVGIWEATSSGDTAETLDWEATEGDWSVVVMNADGSPGVDAEVGAAARAPFVFHIGLGLLIGGFVVFFGALAGVVLAARGRPDPADFGPTLPHTAV
jgi:hypothetical protein